VPSEDEIVDYGEETWEVSFDLLSYRSSEADIQSILRYMVSSGLSNGMVANRPRDSVLQLLLSSGLMADM
jgi:transcription initiation factor TFIIH subunit 4